jgi:hypothetical protein
MKTADPSKSLAKDLANFGNLGKTYLQRAKKRIRTRLGISVCPMHEASWEGEKEMNDIELLSMQMYKREE